MTDAQYAEEIHLLSRGEVMDISNKAIFPSGYGSIENEIYQLTTTKKKKIINSTVSVIGCRSVANCLQETTTLYVEVAFINSRLEKRATRTYGWDEVKSGKFMNTLPDFVIIEPGCTQKAKEILCWIIQNGMQDCPIEEEIIHPFGWDDKKFYWKNGTKAASGHNEYQIAAEAAVLLKFGSDSLNAAILASIHGPLVEFLIHAGITHNFTTDFYGESGIGKTTLCRICVNGDTGVMISAASDRRAATSFAKRTKDATVVVDDFNIAESERTKRRNQQTVSELIQMSCDSATVLMEEGDHRNGFFHLVVNREEELKNISTINRTFSVKMTERLPLGQYEHVEDFSGEKMQCFIYFLIRFIENDYDRLATKAGADYRMFLCDARRKYEGRIADTIAVQKVLKKIIISYYKRIEFDERSIQRMDSLLEDSIDRVGREMRNMIAAKKSGTRNKEALQGLFNVIFRLGNGYDLAKNEKRYWKEKDNASGEQKIGFCVKEGYLSFDMETMLRLINSDENTGEEVSKGRLSTELREYCLAFVDSERKLCTRMKTRRRMYHVKVEELLDVCYKDTDDERPKRFILEYFTRPE